MNEISLKFSYYISETLTLLSSDLHNNRFAGVFRVSCR